MLASNKIFSHMKLLTYFSSGKMNLPHNLFLNSVCRSTALTGISSFTDLVTAILFFLALKRNLPCLLIGQFFSEMNDKMNSFKFNNRMMFRKFPLLHSLRK